jgi:hypothetical protein
LSGEDQQAIAELQNRHKPPILLHGLLHQMVASPLQIQQALGKAKDSTKGQELEKKRHKFLWHENNKFLLI